jgi:hypothetical protein
VQDIDLIAWGQDVHLFNGEIISSQTWTNDKPYLIYNSILVDTNEILMVDAGTRIHLHRGSTFYIAGTLIVSGSVEEPVHFQGDRLESIYDDVPGQWNGLYFLNGSQNNRMDHVQIRNAISGVHLGNLFTESEAPDLLITNAIIEHMTYAGISTISATVDAENCIIGDCGFYGLVLTTGGSYRFTHCTVANYWNYSNRITPSLQVTNYYNINDTLLITKPLLRADFGNCIIYGNRELEIDFDEYSDVGDFNYQLDHCLVRVDTSVNTGDLLHYTQIFTNQDPGFVSVFEYDYQLDTLSFAKDRGSISIGSLVPADILGAGRLSDLGPDLGAYERIELK